MKFYIHTCPICGKIFQNDEPEKGYLCDECDLKELKRILDEWDREERNIQ